MRNGLALGFLTALLGCGAGAPSELKLHQATSRDALSVCSAGATTPGLDVSSYQGSIDWNQVAGAGIKWAYAKATEGTGYRDPTFPGNWSGMGSAGVARGAYHFFHPGTDGTAQADYFLSYVGDLGPGDLPPMLDWEVSDGASGSTAIANAQAFINEVAARTGRQTVVYTSPGIWSGFGLGGAFSGSPLWVAEYFNCYCDNSSCPSMPGGWSNWVFWQYSDRGSIPGIGGAVDLDVFNGDASALAGLAGGAASCSSPIAVGHPVGQGGAVSGACGGAMPAPVAPSGCGALAPGEGLGPNQAVTSCDGRFSLVMQGDGNVVEYENGIALWDSKTGGSAGQNLYMQGDGNLVLYSGDGCPLWASKTGGNSGARLAIQDDGNMVVYAGSSAVWSSGSGPIPAKPSGCGSMAPGTGLGPGDSISACGGCFFLVMQGDGNLVMYKKDGTALWSSRTASLGGYEAVMQGDGNLVVYGKSGCPLWSSQTGGNPGAWLGVQDDGNVVVYSSGNTALWNAQSVACAGGCNCNPPPPPPPSTDADAGSPSDTGPGPTSNDAGSPDAADAGGLELQPGGSELVGAPGTDSKPTAPPSQIDGGCGSASGGFDAGLLGLALAFAMRRRR